MRRSCRVPARGHSTVGVLIVVTLIVAVLATLVYVASAYARKGADLEHCATNQWNILGGCVAYGTTEEVPWPSPWPHQGVAPLHPSGVGDARQAHRIAVRSFEVLAATLKLPSSIFTCRGGHEHAPTMVPSTGPRTGPQWGDVPGERLSYAFDWAAPAEPAAARVILADRDPRAHWGRVVACFGDCHTKLLDRRRLSPAAPPCSRTEDPDGGPILAEAINPDAGPGPVPDDIFSTDGDGGAPLQAGGGNPQRTWVK